MLKRCLTVSLIGAALAGALAHGADFVSVSGSPLKSGFGDCVRTGYWTPASEPCEGAVVQLAMQDAPRMPSARVAQATAALFAFDSDELDPDARRSLDALLARFEPEEIHKVFVIAHADRIGATHYNVALSERRLEAVRNYLAEKGLMLPVLFGEVRGSSEPITAGRCDDMGPEKKTNAALVACLRPDRRVEVEVLGAPRQLARTAKRTEY
ncbi:MAG: OmpA family protein [Burkholderiales bacterium]